MRWPEVHYPHTVQVKMIVEARYVPAVLKQSWTKAKVGADYLRYCIAAYSEKHPDGPDPLASGKCGVESMAAAELWIPVAVNSLCYNWLHAAACVEVLHNQSIPFDSRFKVARSMLALVETAHIWVFAMTVMIEILEEALGIERDGQKEKDNPDIIRVRGITIDRPSTA